MAKSFNTSFLGGEVSDRFMARIDSALYDKTLRVLENFIIHPTGGLDFAPGSVFICEAKTNNGPVRLLPFEKSSSEKYVLELSEQACRFYKDKARILDGTNPLEIVTPWLGADLKGLQGAQKENRLYLAHGSYQVSRLGVYGDNAWTLSTADIDVTLAVGHANTPFLTAYFYSNDLFTKRPNPSVLPVGTANGCAFSPDGLYLAVGHLTSPFITIYKRSGDTFVKLADPDILPPGSGYSCAFSPDSLYVAVGTSGSPWIIIYKRSGDTFTKLPDPAVLPASTVSGCAFSADGVYLAVGHGSSPCIYIYKRSGDTFTKLSDPAVLPAGLGAYGCAFSPDGNYLAVGSGASPFITIYKRTGDTFTKLANPSTLPTGVGYGCAFSLDGLYFAVAHDTSPYVTIYKRSGDTFTKLTNPSTLPTGIGRGCAFAPDALYLAVAHAASPYITIYKRSADTFTKLANPSTLPAGNGFGCAFIPDAWQDVPWGSAYPKALTFHDQRLVLARDGTIFGSKTGWPQLYTQDAADESAGFEYSLAGDTLEEILWMRTKAHNVVVGTTLGEWLLTGGNAPITGSNIYADRVSGHGSTELCAVLANESLLYVQKGGQRLREFLYSLERGGYVSPDLSMLAEHIGELGFSELAWQRSPLSMLWIPQPAGGLASLTLDRNSNIVAWGRHPRGGLVKSMAIVSGGEASSGEDTIYMCVQRQINGATKQYIEYLSAIRRPADPKDCHYVDCGKVYDFSATQDLIEAAASYPLMDHGDCESTDIPHVEGDAESHNGVTSARSGDRAYAGNYSFRATKTVAAGSYGSQYFVDNLLTTDLHGFVPGRKYRMAKRVWIPSVGGPSPSKVTLRLGYYDGGAWSYFSQAASLSEQWELLQVEMTIPLTATAATAYFFFDSTVEAGKYFYFDDLKLRSPVLVTATGHPFVNDEFVRITGVVGMTELNGNVYMVKNKAADSFELYLTDGTTFADGAEMGSYVSGGLLEKVIKDLSGLDHLEGETVAVYADGEELGQEVVASGAITIDAYAAKIHVGLPYTGKIHTQRLGHFQPVKIPQAQLLLYKSRGGKVGSNEATLLPIRYDDTGEKTGPQRVSIGGRFDREGSIMIVQDQPLPMSVLGIVGEMSVGE